MSDLTEKKCLPCEGGVDPLSREQAAELMGQLNDAWTLSDDGKMISREFSFKDFYQTMSFVNAVAHVANLDDHHPDMEVGWGRCLVQFMTHAIDGLSENDLICAAKVDRLLD